MAGILRNLNLSSAGRRICGVPQVGLLASSIPTGFPLPALLLNDIDAGVPNRLYSVEILTRPGAGLLYVYEDSSLSFTGAPDGAYSGTQRVRKFDLSVGLVSTADTTYGLTIGSVAPAPSTVSGVTISPAAASVSGGGTLTFASTVAGTNGPSQAVTYSYTAGSMIGNVYTAPAAGQSIQAIQVTARSDQNPAFSATATITVPAAGTVTVTDSDYQAWLESDDAIPNVLVETFALVGGVLTPIYWSTCGYTSEGTASPTHYAPVISTSIPFRASLSIAGGASVGAGTLDVDNTDGVNEALIGYDFDGQPVYEYFGDLRWSRADYRRVFKGKSAGMVRKDERSLALRLREMTQRLDVAMTDHKLGGSGANQDQVIPLAFGEVENVSGLLTSPGATLERAFHDGPIKGFGEVRGAGLPVAVIAHLETGRCEPTEDNGSAVVTASIQGDNYGGVFRKTIATVIQRMITGFGPAADRCTDADIDLANFAAFDAAHQQTIGYSVDARENLYAACDFIARSVGAQLVPNSDGMLQLIQIALPASGTSTDIRAEHLIGPLKPVQHIDAITGVKLGFCRSYTVQETVAGGVPAELAEMFKTEWLTATAGEGARDQRNTALQCRAETQAEADREWALWGPGRDIFEFDGLAPLLMLKLGQPVTVFDELNGMAAGKPGQILELTPDYDNRRVKGRILV